MRIRGILVLAALAAFAACGELQPIDDLLFLQTPRGVAVIRAGAAAPTFRSAEAVPSRDWSTVVRTRWSGATTRVAASIPASGTPLWAQDVSGTLRTKVVSEDGHMAALGPQTERHYSVGRRHTRLTVVGERTETQSFDLAGNLEPEAFSTDHTNLFVLQYRPALAPNSYQVRRLDLATGKLHDIYTPDKHLQESMRGDARVQAISPDGSRLYTLYSLRTAHGSHSFIHVLNLDEKWAHCIDLPADFGIGAGSTALSVSADGNRLFVANGAAHAVAEVDTQALQVVRSAPVDFGVPRDAFAAQSNDTLYVGSGSTLTSIDVAGLTKGSTWTMDQRITGIQIEEDPGYIYVGLRNRIAVIDPVTGKRIKSLDPPGVGMIGLLGRASRTINAVPEHFTCAC